MLDKETYLKGIKYLNAYYTNFNFNINDDLKLKVWYEQFQLYENEDYTHIIKSYCTDNLYPPQSPSHIFEYMKTQLTRTYLEDNQAWNYTLALVRRVNYDFRRFYKECEYSIISETVKALENEFQGILTEDLKYLKIKFIKLYEDNVKQHATQRVKQADIRSISNVKQIGE